MRAQWKGWHCPVAFADFSGEIQMFGALRHVLHRN